MSVQTSYEFKPRPAIEGNIDNNSLLELVSKSAENEIGFGRAVVRGTDLDNQVKLPAGATPNFFGIAVRILGLQNPNSGSGERVSYLDKESVAVGTSGYFWVYTEQAVNAGDPVYYRHTAGAGGTDLGRFRKDADTATAGLISGAKFETSRLDAGLVIVHIPPYRA